MSKELIKRLRRTAKDREDVRETAANLLAQLDVFDVIAQLKATQDSDCLEAADKLERTVRKYTHEWFCAPCNHIMARPDGELVCPACGTDLLPY